MGETMVHLRVRAMAAAVFAVTVFAGAAEARPVEVEPWAEVFANYEYNVSGYNEHDPRFGDNDRSAFELNRIWIGLDGQLTERWGGHLIFGAVRTRDLETAMVDSGEADDPATPADESQVEVLHDYGATRSGSYDVIVYKAYLRYTQFRYMQLDFGLISDAYTPGISKFWRHRYVQEYPMFDRRLSRSPYGDMGVSLWGEFPGGFGGYRLTALNGEGGRAAETGAGKAFEARVHLAPFAMSRWMAGARVMGFWRRDLIEAESPEVAHTVLEGLAQYDVNFNDAFGASVTGEYIRRDVTSDDVAVPEVTSTVLSAWADARLWTNFGLVARYDRFDPDDTDDADTGEGDRDEETSVLAGVWVKPIEGVRFCVNVRENRFEERWTDIAGETVQRDPERLIVVNSEFEF
ncbi:MAG: hypothetical protein KJ042_00745 [Deltaproteobacteria bacterium]|nr:hypothetical protein [Deltaproteobacteria bacterium]